MNKNSMSELGFVVNNAELKSPLRVINELRYLFFGLFVEFLAIPMVILGCIAVYIKEKIRPCKNKALFGTSSIVFLKEMKSVFANEFDIEYFVFRNNASYVENVTPITPTDICPSWLAKKYPILICKYVSFLWALLQFRVFVFYFDGGFLDRTFLLWRLEPIIYQLLGKKVAISPYGADVWDTRRNINIWHKYGHLAEHTLYFLDDFKREKRIYWWCKYVNMVFVPVDYVRYVPRVDILTLTGQVLDINNHRYKFNEDALVRILHFANNGIRKGSKQIEDAVRSIRNKYPEKIDYKALQGVDRQTAMVALEDCHVFIDNVIDGLLSYSALEAMLAGKIVVTRIDQATMTFYKNILPEYYNRFASENPMIIVEDDDCLLNALEDIVLNSDGLRSKSLESRRFAERIVCDNTNAWRMILKTLFEDQN